MSEQKHTPGPWGLNEQGDGIFGPEPDEWGIGNVFRYGAGGGGLSDEEQKANARRIVACVNALEGIGENILKGLQGRMSGIMAGGLLWPGTVKALENLLASCGPPPDAERLSAYESARRVAEKLLE